ncbi:MAG: hypothetical protein OEY63_06260, partial [Gemmatimonadota bacterium]|nr:hypothetical protein [Gemmatimonadota bacterium]
GAFFVAFEGLAFAMSLKSKHQLAYLEAVMDAEDANSVELVDLKRQEFQDWAVVLAFNHLVAAAEAYVSAYLWDFPANLIVRNLPGGNMAVGMNLALP